jgi:chromosome segregation ATPase
MSETQDYLEPLKEEMARVEAEIAEAEKRLRGLRQKRTGLGRALAALDPQWAASNSKRKPKNTGKTASQTKVDEVAEWIREHKPSETFTNHDLSREIPLHSTTVARVTKQLHDEGVLRIDHMSGRRNTERNFRLITASDA